jgi:hypothetical protein
MFLAVVAKAPSAKAIGRTSRIRSRSEPARRPPQCNQEGQEDGPLAGPAEQKDNVIATLDSNTGIGLSRVPAGGTMPQHLTNPDEKHEATHRWPQILPGGQAVLFTGNKTASEYDDSTIEVLSLKTGHVGRRTEKFGSRHLPSELLRRSASAHSDGEVNRFA